MVNTYLYNAMRKYGIENFSIETIDQALLDEQLLDKEMEWIARLNSTNRNIGYNETLGGQSGIPTPESLAKRIGQKRSPEARARMSAAQRGRVVSEETRAKLSAKIKGRPLSPERYAAYCANPPGLGKKKTPEQVERMKVGMRAAWTPELRAEQSKRQLESRAKKPRPGHPMSEENKQKLIKANRERWASMDVDERKEKSLKASEKLKGRKQPQEEIARRTESLRKAWTPEKRRAFGEKQAGRKGHLHTPESKAKMRESALRRIERSRLGKAA